MSEIPARLRDAILNHVIPARPAVLRRQAYVRRNDGAVAFADDEGWLRLPGLEAEPGDEEPVCSWTTPEGFSNRFETQVFAACAKDVSEPVTWRRRDRVLASWRAGELLLDPAARHAIDADGIGGEEPAWGVRTFPLCTPTLPPATHTNCYLVGRGPSALIVDPGSPYPEELDRFEAAYQRWVGRYGRAGAIFLTHHHGDHVSGATALRERLGLPVWAHALTADLLDFQVDRRVADNESLGEWVTVFTPGHAPGHLCLWNPASKLIVAGDMVAAIGSIVVDPSEGDMAQYLQSLARLKALGPRGLYPAHGAYIQDAIGRLDQYTAHRLWREDRIYEALLDEPSSLGEITRRAYTDVSTAVLWLAERSALAHLIKLECDGRATLADVSWARSG